MPEALSAVAPPVASSSSCDRSSPRVFFAAALVFFGWVRPGVLASSSASSASLSAFLRAASAFFAASASLEAAKGVACVSPELVFSFPAVGCAGDQVASPETPLCRSAGSVVVEEGACAVLRFLIFQGGGMGGKRGSLLTS